ncbi:MAG: hypothetical protein KC609_03895 [Myxococcales bacterium]|nr:hypothetical protein [Myxococcales bacterium]
MALSQLGGESYLEAVERFFGEVRKSGLILSPKDTELVLVWEEHGMPLKVIFRGILRGIETYRASNGRRRSLPSTLSYFKSIVEDEFSRYRSRSMPAYDEEDESDFESYRRSLLKALIDSLIEVGQTENDPTKRDAYRYAYRKLNQLRSHIEAEELTGTVNTPDFYSSLSGIRREMFKMYFDRLPRTEQEKLHDDMRDEVEQIKKTFGRQASKEKCQALFEQHLVRQHQLYPLNWV